MKKTVRPHFRIGKSLIRVIHRMIALGSPRCNQRDTVAALSVIICVLGLLIFSGGCAGLGWVKPDAAIGDDTERPGIILNDSTAFDLDTGKWIFPQDYRHDQGVIEGEANCRPLSAQCSDNSQCCSGNCQRIGNFKICN
jgi:hypothetical protein